MRENAPKLIKVTLGYPDSYEIMRVSKLCCFNNQVIFIGACRIGGKLRPWARLARKEHDAKFHSLLSLSARDNLNIAEMNQSPHGQDDLARSGERTTSMSNPGVIYQQYIPLL